MKINFKNILFYLSITALLTPFFVDTQTYFPFIIGKATVFRIIIGLMLIIWSLLIFSSHHKETNGGKRLFFTSLVKAVIIFGIIIFISAFFGIDFYYSFFSNNERMEGVLGIWYFISFFLVITTTFKYLEIEKILKIQIFIGSLYSLIALSAFLKLVPVIAYNNTNLRFSGHTGNPSFFAVYLLFNAFLALYFYFRQYNYNKKLFNWWLIPFFIQSFLIFVTLTRGAMLGYLVGVISIALAIIFFSKNKNILLFKKLAIIFLVLIFGITIFTFAGKNTDFVKNNVILNRFSSVSLTDPTALSRLFSADTAWQSFLQKPFFGWGQENYEAAYIQNFNPEVMKYLPGDFYFDRAHNKPMEVLATNGIFGFLSYLSIFGIAFYFLNQLRKKQEWFLPSLALGGCLIGYFIQNIFIFDCHESYLMFFLVLAFISSLAIMDKNFLHGGSVNQQTKQLQPNYIPKMGNYLIIIAIICAVIFSTTQWVIKPYLVSKGMMKVSFFIKQGEGEQAFQELKKIINDPTFLKDDIVISVKKIYSLHSFRIAEEDRKKIIKALILQAEDAVEKRSWRFSLVNTKGDLEIILAQWDQSWFLKAEESAEMMLLKFPHFPNPHLFASKLFILKGELEKGILEAKKVIEINDKIASAYYILGLAYNESGNMEEAKINFIKAAEFDYPFNDKAQILTIINFLIEEKKYSTIEKLYLQAIQVDPQDVSLYTSLAATYGRMQNKEKAIEYAKKAVELNSALKKEGEDFIQLIKNEEWDKIQD